MRQFSLSEVFPARYLFVIARLFSAGVAGLLFTRSRIFDRSMLSFPAMLAGGLLSSRFVATAPPNCVNFGTSKLR